jgi:hypothetical protein
MQQPFWNTLLGEGQSLGIRMMPRRGPQHLSAWSSPLQHPILAQNPADTF